MKLKTFIKWSGNKSKHLKHILPFIPSSYKTYIEPFVGSGALFLNLQPKKSIINDLNKDLINCWESVKNNPLDILKIFDTFGKIFKPLDNKDKVVLCREITASIEMSNYDYNRAAIFMLMKFCGYNGHIFVNNKFLFGSLDMNIYINDRFFFLEEPMSRNIFEVSKYLNNTDCSIYNKDYKTILSKAKKGDFVFMDPPYVESHNYQFNYNKDEKLDINFIKELYKEVLKLDKKEIRWMMTQADTKEVELIFKKYKIVKFEVYRRGLKKYVNELLIMNY